MSDSVPVKELKETDDTYRVEGTVGEVVGVEVTRLLSENDPVNGSSWVANVCLQGRGHNPTIIEKSNLPTIVGSLQHWHASASSRRWCVPRWHGCTHWKGVVVVEVARSLSEALALKEGDVEGPCCLHG